MRVEETKPLSFVLEACLFHKLRHRLSARLVSDSRVCSLKWDSWALPSTHCGTLDDSRSFPALRVPISDLGIIIIATITITITIPPPHRLLAD